MPRIFGGLSYPDRQSSVAAKFYPYSRTYLFQDFNFFIRIRWYLRSNFQNFIRDLHTPLRGLSGVLTAPTTRQKNSLRQGALSKHGPPCSGEVSCPNPDPTWISPTSHFVRPVPRWPLWPKWVSKMLDLPPTIVLSKFGSEPKFKPEPLGPNSKFSSRFRIFAELNLRSSSRFSQS